MKEISSEEVKKILSLSAEELESIFKQLSLTEVEDLLKILEGTERIF